jgi:hypothetical protein
MRIVLLCAVALMATHTAYAAEQEVFRCEGKDGRITYSDEPCPSSSRSVRKVDDAPPLAIPSAKDAPRNAREAGAIGQRKNTARFDSYVEDRRLEEQIAAQKRACDDLSRRLSYARRDLDAAVASQRASAELALRRIQDEHQLHCARR